MTEPSIPHPPGRPTVAARAALVFVVLWFLLGGLAHFVLTDLESTIVPAWIPGSARQVVLASGAFELLGAAGLLWPRTRIAAGWGLVALTIAVTPANVDMLQHADRFPSVPIWALWLRLPLQLVLLGLILKGSGAGLRPRTA